MKIKRHGDVIGVEVGGGQALEIRHFVCVSEGDLLALEARSDRLPDEEPLPDAQWAALERAEHSLYGRDGYGHGWTSVMTNDGFPMLNMLWHHVQSNVENVAFDEEDQTPAAINNETARRVAAILGIATFGKEFLLK